MPIEQVNSGISLISDSLDSIIESVKSTIQNAVSALDAEKILNKIEGSELINNLLNDSKEEITEQVKKAAAILPYETRFLKAIVAEYANTSGNILDSELVINQHIMQQDILKTNSSLNSADETVQTETRGFFGRLADRIAAAQREVMTRIRGILSGEGTVIERVAAMLGTVLTGIYSVIAETFSPMIMAIASGFLHITGSFSSALDFDIDTVFDKMISSGQKLQEKLEAQKPVWEEIEKIKEKE